MIKKNISKQLREINVAQVDRCAIPVHLFSWRNWAFASRHRVSHDKLANVPKIPYPKDYTHLQATLNIPIIVLSSLDAEVVFLKELKSTMFSSQLADYFYTFMILVFKFQLSIAWAKHALNVPAWTEVLIIYNCPFLSPPRSYN